MLMNDENSADQTVNTTKPLDVPSSSNACNNIYFSFRPIKYIQNNPIKKAYMDSFSGNNKNKSYVTI